MYETDISIGVDEARLASAVFFKSSFTHTGYFLRSADVNSVSSGLYFLERREEFELEVVQDHRRLV